MSFLKRSFYSLILIILLLLAAGHFLPTQYTIARSIVISAHPEKIHAYVSDLKRWPEWEPWTEGDPTMVVTLGEKTQGIGASQSWQGESGNGRLIFTREAETVGIEYDLSFEQGQYRSKASLTYQALGQSSTQVEWRISGDVEIPLIGGYFSLFFKYVTAPLFEEGLRQLKEKVEG
jgi:hypothetical protein